MAYKQRFSTEFTNTITNFNIPPSMCVTFDEVFAKLAPVDGWTMDRKGASQVPLAALEDKRGITLGLLMSGGAELLDPQALYGEN
jgi:uncharacterized membrane protein YjfL (UPF0719 family)